jgi:hypothetical protein
MIGAMNVAWHVPERLCVMHKLTPHQYHTQCLAEAERLCLSDITQDEYEAGALVLMALEVEGVYFPVDAIA